jgi:MATE family multidrug resistance protein
MLWGFFIAVLFSLVFATNGTAILNLLTNKKEVIELAKEFLPWLIIAPLVNAFAFIWDGIYIGTTASKAMRNTMIFSTLFVFLPLFFWAKASFQNHGIWFAFTAFMLSRGLLQTLYAPKVIFNRLPSS